MVLFIISRLFIAMDFVVSIVSHIFFIVTEANFGGELKSYKDDIGEETKLNYRSQQMELLQLTQESFVALKEQICKMDHT